MAEAGPNSSVTRLASQHAAKEGRPARRNGTGLEEMYLYE